jgi:hypothetical protein
MGMNQDKRQHREMKRSVKKAGNRKVRRDVQRTLRDTPEDAAFLEANYGRYTSEPLNGIDRDATRKRRDSEDSDKMSEEAASPPSD